jgi:hypothetical protein
MIHPDRNAFGEKREAKSSGKRRKNHLAGALGSGEKV